MENFQGVAAKMITEMEKHARKLGVRGVIVVASMDEAGLSWVSQMKAVDTMKAIAENPAQEKYPGTNFIAVAYSKAAEMADTKMDSGSNVRPAYQGEFGYQGGRVKKIKSGFILTVFSGATGEQDYEISKAGMNAYENG